MRRNLTALLLVGAVVLAACGDDDDDEGAAATEPATVPAAAATTTPGPDSASDCAAGNTIEADKLTIATGDPAFPPYVINDATPEDGQGFEAAVAMAVARELGFEGEAVTWVRTPFDAAISPGPKNFDFNLQQYGITPERQQSVDFSEGYYTAPQAIFGLADSPAASATSLSELKGLKIGVAAGTTSVTYVEETIQPDSDPLIFNDNAAAKTALETNQIDAVVSDLPTAIYITGVEIPGTKVFGQIEGSGTDEWGLLLAKDSPLTDCVNLALQALKGSGELDQITTEWMSDFAEAPVISAG